MVHQSCQFRLPAAPWTPAWPHGPLVCAPLSFPLCVPLCVHLNALARPIVRFCCAEPVGLRIARIHIIHTPSLQGRGLQSQSGLNGTDAMAIVPNPAKPRPRPDDELCAGSLLTSRVSSETQSTWVTMPHRWHHPPSILRDLASPQHRCCLPQAPAPYPRENRAREQFGAPLWRPPPSTHPPTLPLHSRPAVALPLPTLIIEHALVSSLSLFHGFEPHILSSLPGWLARLFQVPVRRARWGLPNIPTPSSQPLLDSTLNVKIRPCQCFPAICSIHSAPSFACFRSNVPTLS